MAQLNGKEYSTWKEYIEYKFPSDRFNIHLERADSITTFIVTSQEGSSNTKIYLELFNEIACRVTFENSLSPLSIKLSEAERQRALLYADYALRDDQLLETDNYLNIAIYYGWTEKLTFYACKLLREELLYYKGVRLKHLHINTCYWKWTERAGCLMLPIVFPALWIESKIVKYKINRGKDIKIESVEIQPMLKTSAGH